jgi:hypothetical protein
MARGIIVARELAGRWLDNQFSLAISGKSCYSFIDALRHYCGHAR